MRDIGKPRIVTVDWVDTVGSSEWDTKDDVDIKLVKQIAVSYTHIRAHETLR